VLRIDAEDHDGAMESVKNPNGHHVDAETLPLRDGFGGSGVVAPRADGVNVATREDAFERAEDVQNPCAHKDGRGELSYHGSARAARAHARPGGRLHDRDGQKSGDGECLKRQLQRVRRIVGPHDVEVDALREKHADRIQKWHGVTEEEATQLRIDRRRCEVPGARESPLRVERQLVPRDAGIRLVRLHDAEWHAPSTPRPSSQKPQ